ncbi:MAG: glycosyltransferase [Rhodobacteraceae bacterium]|nr:glycosyltransferase [Paracoccaceae bacterium]
MSAPLSIVIPTLNSAATLGPVLASAFVAMEAGLLKQVIIADGGSDDGIEGVAGDVGAQLVTSTHGRGRQMAAGAKVARGDWLLFLHADTVLSDGWAGAVQAHINNCEHAGYFRLAFDAEGFAPRFVAGWANLRSRLFGLPYGDQGMLISRQLYHDVGGFPDLPLMEDVAMARALRGQFRLLPAVATTSAQRFQKDGWVRRGRRNLVTLLMYFLGWSPEVLAQRYDRQF